MVYVKDPTTGQLKQFNTQADADAYTQYAQQRNAGQETLTGEGDTQASANIQGAESRYQNDFEQQHPGLSDPYMYQYGGDPLWAQQENQKLQGQAQGYADRAAPTIDTSGMQPFTDAASGAATGMGAVSSDVSHVATGAGYQGQMAAGTSQQGAAASQMGAGNALMQLSQMPSGPSAAEMAMKRTMDQASSQQASLAAGARGGNAALAMQNAAANEAQIGGQGTRDIGTQRAAEDLANRTFAANAASAAGQAYGGAGSTYGGAGNTFGGAAQTQTNAYGTAATALQGQGNINTTLSGQMGQIASDNAGNQVKTTALNDSSQMEAQQMGYGLMGHQLDQNANFDTGVASRSAGAAESAFANRDKSGEGTITGSAGGDKALGAGIQAVGSIAAMSDIRAKKNIVPADEDISDAFRQADGYGYDYRDPNQPGARPGRNYGPMAQELERTPAGASVVKDTPRGKAIDTSRLSLLNASETSKLRKEVDSLKRGQPMADDIRGTQMVRPDGYDDPYSDGPQPGYMTGRAHLDPGLAPQVPHGAPRPFAPGEYVRNPDGSWSSEVTMSVQNPKLNGGRATNIPSMWLKDGKPYIAKDEDEAAGYATQSGLPFRSYDNIDAANQASIDRESAWQPIQNPKDARRVEPLWDQNGKAARVQATPLVFSSENGGNFRTPDEQLAYVDSVKRRPAATPLFYDPSGEGTFRTPLEQLRYANTIKEGVPPMQIGPKPASPKTEAKIAQLSTQDAAEEARIKKLRTQLSDTIGGIGQSLSAPTTYATPVQPVAYGY